MIRYVSLFWVSIILASCGGNLYSVQQAPVVLERARPQQEMHQAIVAGARLASYQPESEQQGQITARFSRGELSQRVAIDYTETQFTLRYLDGSNAIVQDETGADMINEDQTALMRRLSRAIVSEIRRPEREAAEAAEQERRAARAAVTQQALQVQAEIAAQQAQAQAQQQVYAPPPEPQPSTGGGVVHHQQQHRTVDQTFNCCLNGAFYSCPNQQAFQECSTMSPSGCTRQTSRDSSCN